MLVQSPMLSITRSCLQNLVGVMRISSCERKGDVKHAVQSAPLQSAVQQLLCNVEACLCAAFF